MKKIREYIDINQVKRTLEYVEPGYFVQYHRDRPPSPSSRWKMSDGSVVQIPETMWEGFEYIDKVIKDQNEKTNTKL